jgi:cytochrome c553
MNAQSRACAGFLIGSLLVAAVPGRFAACAVTGAASSPTAKAAAASPASAPPPAATPPCEACHGAHGEGMAAAHVPRLAGQSADYLQKQLDDYADGTRDNPVMRNFSKALKPQQRAQFAARYATLSAPYIAQTTSLDAVRLARGHQLAFQGDEARRVQACNGCHGPDGVGVAYAAPYLAGQSAEYLAAALRAFKQGTRTNDAGEAMRSVAQRLDDADVAAVAGYFASQGQALAAGAVNHH